MDIIDFFMKKIVGAIGWVIKMIIKLIIGIFSGLFNLIIGLFKKKDTND